MRVTCANEVRSFMQNKSGKLEVQLYTLQLLLTNYFLKNKWLFIPITNHLIYVGFYHYSIMNNSK